MYASSLTDSGSIQELSPRSSQQRKSHPSLFSSNAFHRNLTTIFHSSFCHRYIIRLRYSLQPMAPKGTHLRNLQGSPLQGRPWRYHGNRASDSLPALRSCQGHLCQETKALCLHPVRGSLLFSSFCLTFIYRESIKLRDALKISPSYLQQSVVTPYMSSAPERTPLPRPTQPWAYPAASCCSVLARQDSTWTPALSFNFSLLSVDVWR